MDIFNKKEKQARLDALLQEIEVYNSNRTQLIKRAKELYIHRKATLKKMKEVQAKLQTISNLPKWCIVDVNSAIQQVADFDLVVQYEADPVKFAEITDSTGRTAATIAGIGGGLGAGIGVGGPAAAMSIATVMGTASTGTAISALSGVAATNAALAWLGGGAVAAGGAGIAGGHLVLAMLGPIGVAAIGGGVGFFWARSKNKKKAEEYLTQLDSIKQDNRLISGKLEDLDRLINRHLRFETIFSLSVKWVNSLSSRDYMLWNDMDKHELEKLVNNLLNVTQCINERI